MSPIRIKPPKSRLSPFHRRICRSAIVAIGFIGLVGASIGAYIGIIQYGGNLHSVVAGQLYRSAQLGDDRLKEVVQQYGIKSIVNLRGASRGASWYEDEIATAGALHVAHYDVALSDRRVVTAAQIRDIMETLRNAQKPILIHCKFGADRSGLIAALYLLKIAGQSADIADGQLSLLYGHFPYLGSKTGAMDESFWRAIRD